MEAEQQNNSSSLEATFREQAKHYQRLLRWGVDKVFVDNSIASMLHDARLLLDENENNKAFIVLSELKKQIRWFEDQGPIKKAEIEKQQLIEISALEFRIETIVSLDKGGDKGQHRAALAQTHGYLNTLELSRVAIQNGDWPEAQAHIDRVSQALVEFDSWPEEDAPKTENTSTIEKFIAFTSEEQTTLKTDTDESETLKIKLKTPEPESTASSMTMESPAPLRDSPQETTEDKSSELSSIAQSLLSTDEKSAIGKLINVKDLHRSFQMFDKTNIENLCIGFIATPETIDAELSCFSRKPITLCQTNNQIVLIRLPVSRQLTIYLLGIPLNFDKNQIKYNASQFSAIFVDTKDAEESDLPLLRDNLSELTWLNANIYIKNHDNVQTFKKTRLLDKLKFLASESSEHRFIDYAAGELDQFSKLK